MRAGIYARVSSKRQAQDQTIEQQLVCGRTAIQERGWDLSETHISRDDGYSGARLSRPGLDRLRDDVALAEMEVVVITAPDRLARKYLHQVLLLEEFERSGVRVEFVERPMSDDPNDQLLLQIRGAVAEDERTLITERLRRGKLAKLRARGNCSRGHAGTTAITLTPTGRAILRGSTETTRKRSWSRTSLPPTLRRGRRSTPSGNVWSSGGR